ncbi:hypothetical protein DFH09DRAFT_1105312 [Mycena vulgaris]|nr:hypothetical protein DFH09DRAFT_1105312 [Mycena vulgaris]
MPPVAGMATAVCARDMATETVVEICSRALTERDGQRHGRDGWTRVQFKFKHLNRYSILNPNPFSSDFDSIFDGQNKRYMFGLKENAIADRYPRTCSRWLNRMRSSAPAHLFFSSFSGAPPSPTGVRGKPACSAEGHGNKRYHSASTAARVLQHAPFKLHHARAAMLARGWTGISLRRICPNESVGGSASRVRAVRTTHAWHPALSACLVRARAARSACTFRAHTARASGHRIHAVAHGSAQGVCISTVQRARISVVRAPTRHLRGTCRRARVGDTASGHSQCALSLVHPRGRDFTSVLAQLSRTTGDVHTVRIALRAPGAWVTPLSPKARPIHCVASLVLYGPCAQDARALAEFLTPFEPGMRWVYVHDTDAGRCGTFGRVAFADEVQRRAPWFEGVRCEWFDGRIERLTRGKADGPGWVEDVLDETKMCEADIALDAARCRSGQRIDRHIQRGFFSTSSLRLFLAGFLARGTFPPAFRNVVKPRSQPEMPPLSIDQKPHHKGDGGARGANGKDNGGEQRDFPREFPGSSGLQGMKGGGAGRTHQTIRGFSGQFMRRSEGVEKIGVLSSERSTSINKTGPSNEMRVQDARTKRCQEEYSNKSARCDGIRQSSSLRPQGMKSQAARGKGAGHADEPHSSSRSSLASCREEQLVGTKRRWRGYEGAWTAAKRKRGGRAGEPHRLRRYGGAARGGLAVVVKGEVPRRTSGRGADSEQGARKGVDGGGNGWAGWPCGAEGGAVVNEVADCGAATLTSSGDGGRGRRRSHIVNAGETGRKPGAGAAKVEARTTTGGRRVSVGCVRLMEVREGGREKRSTLHMQRSRRRAGASEDEWGGETTHRGLQQRPAHANCVSLLSP